MDPMGMLTSLLSFGADLVVAGSSFTTLRQVQRIHVLPQFLLLLKAFHFIIVPNQPTAEVQLLLSALRWMDQKLDPCKNRC